ncbi:hypothetical protein EZV62_003407 [Acer yangbiense]|uniref:AAA+ ATPase domain-containing protein n=1 Tax=Acer yangbiense TaxID=1000413 RepID=A0A5C7III2_9ROSI|nr:hypothetical protein EZV62_003407 [Acer yangbiense]
MISFYFGLNLKTFCEVSNVEHCFTVIHIFNALKTSGASEENIRELFSKAYRTAPSIVFIDEIDAIASKRENLQREMEKRIVTQLMTCMDESHRFVQSNDGDSNSEASDQRPGYVLVIGATNRPDAVDPALRRPGRFDREIVLGVPDENARVEILSVITRNLRELGVDLETGFLLYRPPGCGKTLIAKTVANEAGANFIHIKGLELLNKYVGESELAVRTLFSLARTCSPCILFFDEVDALTTKRGKEGGWVVERLWNQLLIELDGADQRRCVFVIGTTNRPDVMDRAVLRPGRFVAQMKACESLSGADLSALLCTLSPDDWEVAHLYLDVVLRKVPRLTYEVIVCSAGQPYQTQSNDARRDKGQIGHRRRRGPATVRTEDGDDSDGPVSQVIGKEELNGHRSVHRRRRGPATVRTKDGDDSDGPIIGEIALCSSKVRLVCGAATKLYVHTCDIAAHHAIELVLRFA